MGRRRNRFSIDSKRHWYGVTYLTLLLWPLSLVFALLAGLRRSAYRRGILSVQRLPVPVIVVGNISVGGSGKTPLVTAIVHLLQAAGFQPGIISRGYGGRSQTWPQVVTASSDPALVGDEPVLLARRCQCPVVVAPDRVAAGRLLLAQHDDCDVIVSDDGLQHYALARTLEIAVIDGRRRFGNGLLLPAGPLREPLRRLKQVDFVVANGQAADDEYVMTLLIEQCVNLADPTSTRPLQAFHAETVHAVAGIADPERFFAALEQQGLHITRHPFPDHHAFQASDFVFADNQAVLMTEKDAVKCVSWAQAHYWYVPVQAHIETTFSQQLLAHLRTSNG